MATLKQLREAARRRQAESIERRHDAGLYEVRGVWAPKTMHAALRRIFRERVAKAVTAEEQLSGLKTRIKADKGTT